MTILVLFVKYNKNTPIQVHLLRYTFIQVQNTGGLVRDLSN